MIHEAAGQPAAGRAVQTCLHICVKPTDETRSPWVLLQVGLCALSRSEGRQLGCFLASVSDTLVLLAVSYTRVVLLSA